ncbi:MAG TPA: hypothetical protein VIM02_12565 [Rhizomicrobium sp.]|jgi:hypothetical protein
MAAIKKVLAPLRLAPVKDVGQRSAIMDAIANFDVRKAPAAWKELAALSPNAEVEIEANPEGVFKTGDDFQATATVYVRLPETPSLNADSFPAHVMGRVGKNNKISITDIDIDTSSFFGGPEIPWHFKSS